MKKKEEVKTMYKFLRCTDGKTIKSESGTKEWTLGKWEHQKGEIELCENGFHCSRDPYQAFSYVQGEVLGVVEVKGKSDIKEDKEAWSDMRVVKAYKWEKKDSVAFAIYAAELVIDLFDKKYPYDDRPRKAIEVAKKWLKRPSKSNQAAAGDAARAAGDAARAAGDAARAAGDAAGAAWDAARAAAGAARAAAGAAWDAARDAWAAGDDIYKKCADWMLEHIKEKRK